MEDLQRTVIAYDRDENIHHWGCNLWAEIWRVSRNSTEKYWEKTYISSTVIKEKTWKHPSKKELEMKGKIDNLVKKQKDELENKRNIWVDSATEKLGSPLSHLTNRYNQAKDWEKKWLIITCIK